MPVDDLPETEEKETLRSIDGLPKLYVQCLNTYQEMKRTAHLPDEEGNVIWEGHLTIFMAEQLGYKVSAYSRIVKALTEMGCISQRKRGAGSGTYSEWQLIGEPTIEVFDYYKTKTGKRYHKINAEKQRIKDLIALTNNLEARIINLERRLGLTLHD